MLGSDLVAKFSRRVYCARRLRAASLSMAEAEMLADTEAHFLDLLAATDGNEDGSSGLMEADAQVTQARRAAELVEEAKPEDVKRLQRAPLPSARRSAEDSAASYRVIELFVTALQARHRAPAWYKDIRLRALVLTVLLVGALAIFSRELGIAYEGSIAKEQPLAASRYEHPEQFAKDKKLQVLYWAELGRDRRLVRERIPGGGFGLRLSGFSIGVPWESTPSWHIDAGDYGSLRAYFPPGRVERLALYLSDGDSHWRTSRIRSATQDIVADRLSPGRWVYLPLTRKERRTGEKTIELYRLTGSSIAISAVVALGARRQEEPHDNSK